MYITGFSLQAYSPLVQTGGELELFSDDLILYLVNWSHETTASIGYDKASMTLNLPPHECHEWMTNGLGRHIVLKSPGLKEIWVGFVNRISISFGGISRSIGPLLDITNSVNVEYTKIYPDTSIPLHGIPSETGFIDDLESQALYGIFAKTINGGSLTDIQADQRANSYLEQHAYPASPENIQFGSQATYSIKFDLLGYYHWLFYEYTDTGSGTVNLDQKIQDVITADPNGMISVDFSNIDANTTQIPNNEGESREAASIINSLVVDSDGTYNRYTFGIYGDRIAYYKQISSTIVIDYYIHTNDPAGRIYGPQDEVVEPWDVEVGKWRMTASEDIGRFRGGEISPSDPSVHFIEGIKFQIPIGLTINTGRITGFSGRFSNKTMIILEVTRL